MTLLDVVSFTGIPKEPRIKHIACNFKQSVLKLLYKRTCAIIRWYFSPNILRSYDNGYTDEYFR